jgi:hypothetical protein
MIAVWREKKEPFMIFRDVKLCKLRKYIVTYPIKSKKKINCCQNEINNSAQAGHRDNSTDCSPALEATHLAKTMCTKKLAFTTRRKKKKSQLKNTELNFLLLLFFFYKYHKSFCCFYSRKTSTQCAKKKPEMNEHHKKLTFQFIYVFNIS